jgi:hypothetical protein
MSGIQGSLGFQLGNLTLPAAGLAFDAAKGVIKGLTNGTISKRAVTLTATDGWDGRTAAATFSFGALGPFAAGSPSSTVVGRNDTDIALSAFTPPAPGNNVGTVTWSKGGGPWPAWLGVDGSTGRLTGTPSGYASATTVSGLTMRGTDSDGGTALSGAFSITVHPGISATIATARYTTRAGKSVTTAVPSVTPAAIGTMSWTVQTRSGVAPANVTVASNGSLTYTPEAATVGTWTYAMRGTDSAGGSIAETQDVTATIVGALALTAPPTTNVRMTGNGWSQPPVPANLLGTPTWTIVNSTKVCETNNSGRCASGTNGYSINGSSGAVQLITDNTTTATAGQAFVKLTDIDGSVAETTVPFKITARPTPAPIASLKGRWGDYLTGEPFALNVSIGTISSASSDWVDYPANLNSLEYWHSCAGAYPSGFRVLNNRLQGTATGSSAGDATYTKCLLIRDAGDNAYAHTSASVSLANPLTLTGGPTANVTLTKGVAYSWTLTAANLVSTAEWSASGALPANMALASTGALVRTLSGTPTQAGTFPYAITVRDPWDGATKTSSVTLTVVDEIGSSTQSNLSTRVTADFASPPPSTPTGTAPYTWTLLSGALPDGTALEASTGAIKGRPTMAKAYAGIRLRATDANGAVADTNAFTVTVASNLMAVTMPTGTQRFHVNATRTLQATVSGTLTAAAPEWRASYKPGSATFGGTNPAWLTLGSDGTITGRPTALGSAAAYTVAIDPADGAYVSSSFTAQAIAAIAFSAQPTSLSASTGFHANSSAPAVSNAAGSFSYALMSGSTDITSSLPASCPGLSFATSTGRIAGTPTAACSLTGLTLLVTDAADATSATSAQFDVNVVVTPPIHAANTCTTQGPTSPTSYNTEWKFSFATQGAANGAAVGFSYSESSTAGKFNVTVYGTDGAGFTQIYSGNVINTGQTSGYTGVTVKFDKAYTYKNFYVTISNDITGQSSGSVRFSGMSAWLYYNDIQFGKCK